MNRGILYLSVVLFSLASCKYNPIPAPNYSTRIIYLNPKDTTIFDSLGVDFQILTEYFDPADNFLNWNFGDGKSENTAVTIRSYRHVFPGFGNYPVSVYFRQSVTKQILDTASSNIYLSPAQARIIFFTPKDTTLSDSRKVKFDFKIDTIHKDRNVLEWHFSDGSVEKTPITDLSHEHIFPAPGDYI
jgi:hypothetical protein